MGGAIFVCSEMKFMKSHGYSSFVSLCVAARESLFIHSRSPQFAVDQFTKQPEIWSLKQSQNGVLFWRGLIGQGGQFCCCRGFRGGQEVEDGMITFQVSSHTFIDKRSGGQGEWKEGGVREWGRGYWHLKILLLQSSRKERQDAFVDVICCSFIVLVFFLCGARITSSSLRPRGPAAV